VHALPLLLVVTYAVSLVLLSRGAAASEAGHYLLAGRRLTLPAFVATLVTTWYGGILGVGEYAWQVGLSTWLVFGVPYYLAAFLFAVFLAPRLRRTDAVSIPDLLRQAYGPGTALAGSAAVFAMTLPVAYLLMLATLLSQLTGWPLLICAALGAVFSSVYVGLSGFRAVVRTDILQLVLMYGGFALLLAAAVGRIGGFGPLWSALPSDHRTWDGGLGWQAVLVWYLIALQTVVEPTFYQRVFAARSPKVARRGVLVAIVMWAVFDFMTTFCGLAARVLLPDLETPIAAYPTLAAEVLPTWGAAVFTLALFATVMSTLDSYLFLSAATLGHDLAPDRAAVEKRRTRTGLAISAGLSVVGVQLFDSVIDVWHHVGSVVTAGLLLPVIAIHLPARARFSPGGATAAIVTGAGVAFLWIAAGDQTGYPLGLEPMFPALAATALCWFGDRLWRSTAR
jgi:SSS family solute:Na+ symporter